MANKRPRSKSGPLPTERICLSQFIEVKPSVTCLPGPKSGMAAALQNGEIPFPRSGHRLVATRSHLLSIGGYNPDLTDLEQSDDSFYPLLKELWSFNLLTQKWSRVTTTGVMPSELASHATVLCGDFLFVSGGTGVPFGHTSSNDLHMLNLKYHSWQKLQCDGNQPQKQYGHAITVAESKLYVIGGTTGFQYNMDVFALDMNQRVLMWAKLSDNNESNSPQPRYRHEVAHHNGKLFVFGGGTSADVFGFENLDVFDLQKRVWGSKQTKADQKTGEFPRPRRCHGMVEYNDSVYIVGGCDGDNLFNDLWRFEWSSSQWTKLSAKLPVSCFFHGAAVTPEGCLYVFGGVLDKDNKNRTNKLYRVWLATPPLKRFAADVLFHRFPNLLQLTQESLLATGVPKDVIVELEDV